MEVFEPGPGGVVSLDPQPFLRRHQSAPKTQRVMVVAHGYRPSGRLGPMRLLRGKFKGKGAVGGMSPFPVADSPETTPPGPGSNSLWLRPEACIREIARVVLEKGIEEWVPETRLRLWEIGPRSLSAPAS